MRRVMCLVCVLMICMTLAVPVFAAENTFVPSITYKDGPEIVDAEINGEDGTGCVVVTSIKEAREKTTDIYQEDRDLLLQVYEELVAGSMVLPLENKEYVVRELVDVSFVKTGCVEVPHGHKEWLAEEDTTIEVVFDLGLKDTTDLEVLAFVNGEWAPVVSVKNNGNGTVTCVFEDFCPVAFCVENEVEPEPPKTGDTVAEDLGLWVLMLAVATGAVVVLLVNRRKILR